MISIIGSNFDNSPFRIIFRPVSNSFLTKCNNMIKYKAGQKLVYIPLNVMVEVVHVTDYHEDNDPNAFVVVTLPDGDLRSVPVAKQSTFLREGKPRPELQKIHENPAALQPESQKPQTTGPKK